MFLIGGINANALIFDFKLNCRVVAPDAEMHLASVRRVFGGIGKQVEDHLL